jgi:DNA-binding response OmpR family regulator
MKKNILLVEYCTAAIETIQQILHNKIFDITVARSEDVARDLLTKFGFDLLITETLLPKSHGFFLSRFVADNYPRTKIIIISEKLKEADHKEEAITQHGANDFFEKPLNGKEFKKRVLELLEVDDEEIEENEYATDMTTRLHKIPSKEELAAAGEKLKDRDNLPIIEIDLD